MGASLKTRLAVISAHRMGIQAISDFCLIYREDWERILGATYPKPSESITGKRIFQHKRTEARRALGRQRLLERTGIDIDNLEGTP